MRHSTLCIVLILLIIMSLPACNNANPTPLPTTDVANVPATATVLLVIPTSAPTATIAPTTASPTATSTNRPTPTPTSTTTSTPGPTVTSSLTATPRRTATLRLTTTPRPTRLAPTATTAPPSTAAVPPPEVFQFTVGGFVKYLDYAHQKYRAFLVGFGPVVKGDHVGNCNWFFQLRGEILGIVAFTSAPEPWTEMVNEYNAMRTQAIVLIEPINAVCQGGGGTVPAGIDQQIVSFYDKAQNRMYEMLKQAKSMQ